MVAMMKTANTEIHPATIAAIFFLFLDGISIAPVSFSSGFASVDLVVA